LYEDDVRAVYVRGGLESYQSILRSPFLYVPHDVIVPGALTASDLNDVADAVAPRPVRLEALVDGVNRPASLESLRRTYGAAEGPPLKGAPVAGELLVSGFSTPLKKQ